MKKYTMQFTIYMKTLFFIFSIILNYSCSRKDQTKETDGSISLAFEKTIKKKSFSDVFDPAFEIVKLETSENSMFVKPSKTIFTEELIFIFDEIQKKLFVFNKNGSFNKKLNKHGRGPQEYQSIWDFTIDQNNSLLFIADDFQQKIICYDFDFNFISEKKYPFPFMFFDLLDNQNFLFYRRSIDPEDSENQYHFILTDYEFQIINKGSSSQIKRAPIGNHQKVHKLHDNTYFFYSNENNIVYQTNGTSINPRYTIVDFSGYELPSLNYYMEMEKKKIRSSAIYDDISTSGYILSYYFYEIDKNLLLYMTISNNDYISYINTKTGERWHTDKLIDDFGLFLDFRFSRPAFINNGKLGYYFYPVLANNALEKNPDRYINPALGELIIDKNPFIILLSFKN